jgi:hypothetical protein
VPVKKRTAESADAAARTGQRDAWERGDKNAFWPYDLSLREVFAADSSAG